MADITPSNKELEVRLLCDRSKVPTSPTDTEIHLMCQITAPEDDMVRASVSICAVIDRSGSMKENMGLMRQTLKFMVEQLRPEDRLALVTFDQDVSVEFELTAMNEGGKEKAKKIIGLITERGHTNLSGGLLAGLNVFFQVPSEISTKVESVLLFTDGKANYGITNPKTLEKAARNTVMQIGRNTNIFTFGYGSEHDANILRTIAEAGNGLFYFIENQESIPESFCDCLGGLLSVAAQNIQLTLTAECQVVFQRPTTPFQVTVVKPGKEIQVKVPDIYSGEAKCIVFPTLLSGTKNSVAENLVLAKLSVTGFSVCSSSHVMLESVANVCVDPNCRDPVPSEDQGEILVNRMRIATSEVLEEAKQLSEKGEIKDARQLISDLIHTIQVSEVAKHEVSIYCVESLNEVLAELKDKVSYDSKANKLMNQFAQGHAWQRNNICKPAMLQEHLLMNISPTDSKEEKLSKAKANPFKANPYQNKKKGAMQMEYYCD